MALFAINNSLNRKNKSFCVKLCICLHPSKLNNAYTCSTDVTLVAMSILLLLAVASLATPTHGDTYPDDNCVVLDAYQGHATVNVIAAETIEVCRTLCQEHPECRVADYDRADKSCHMKARYGSLTFQANLGIASTVYLKNKCGESSG